MEAELERIALDLFIEHGYRNVSVEQIAEVAGVSARTFYRYFAAKDDLLTVLPRRLSRHTYEAMLLEPPSRPAFEAFGSAMLTMYSKIDTDELARWLRVTTTDAPSGAAVAARLSIEQREMEPLLLRHMSESPLRSLHTQLIFGAIHVATATAAGEWFRHGGDLVARLEEALRAFGQGLSKLS